MHTSSECSLFQSKPLICGQFRVYQIDSYDKSHHNSHRRRGMVSEWSECDVKRGLFSAKDRNKCNLNRGKRWEKCTFVSWVGNHHFPIIGRVRSSLLLVFNFHINKFRLVWARNWRQKTDEFQKTRIVRRICVALLSSIINRLRVRTNGVKFKGAMFNFRSECNLTRNLTTEKCKAANLFEFVLWMEHANQMDFRYGWKIKFALSVENFPTILWVIKSDDESFARRIKSLA